MGRAHAFAVAEGSVIVTEGDAGIVVPWWSFTKTVIAAAALTLVRDGKLDLDEPVGSKLFTLRQLLQHRAGVGEYGALAEYHRAVADSAEPWPVTELLSRVDADRLQFEPGTGWLYSNVGYLFVRQLIERVVGATLNCALRKRVLEPLGTVIASWVTGISSRSLRRHENRYPADPQQRPAVRVVECDRGRQILGIGGSDDPRLRVSDAGPLAVVTAKCQQTRAPQQVKGLKAAGTGERR
jgi:CubicO group peptidase (beta-lactamase class C family)